MFPKTSRRNFLKISAMLSLSGLLGQSCAQAKTELYSTPRGKEMSTKTEIVVVGAGAAGLGAATTLRDEGYDVIILEGRNRIGGRVWTNHAWPDAPLDMGASWIHAVKGNPLTELAKKFKVKTLPTDYDNIYTYDSAGIELTDPARNRLDQRLADLLAALDKSREALDKDISLGQALKQTAAKLNLSDQAQHELDYAITTAIEHEYAADVSELSLFHWDEGGNFEGGDVVFPGGYDQIINGLAKGLDIRLEQFVRQIEYDPDEGVRITTSQEVFEADYAVITLPLGVLKKGTVNFSPTLPPAKLSAIRRLGMGLLNKLYLRFPEVFWDEDGDFIGYISPRKGEWNEWLNVYKYIGQPILVGFNAGVYGRQIENLTDEALVAPAMKTLQTVYDGAIPQPEAWLISRWANDPFAWGSYSYLPPGATPADRDALAQPVSNRLFFAGEATSRQYQATVHGALLSGQRAAKEISDL
jgi:monoamine oxidase